MPKKLLWTDYHEFPNPESGHSYGCRIIPGSVTRNPNSWISPTNLWYMRYYKWIGIHNIQMTIYLNGTDREKRTRNDTRPRPRNNAESSDTNNVQILVRTDLSNVRQGVTMECSKKAQSIRSTNIDRFIFRVIGGESHTDRHALCNAWWFYSDKQTDMRECESAIG